MTTQPIMMTREELMARVEAIGDQLDAINMYNGQKVICGDRRAALKDELRRVLAELAYRRQRFGLDV